MAVNVTLALVPPDDENIVALRVYESSDRAGSFEQVDRTTDVGAYPDYITSYLTTSALALDDWFYVAWEDDVGGLPYVSYPVKGGLPSIVDQVVQRVMQRDASISLALATQEAEAVVEQFYGVDPYSVTAQPAYRILNGLTYLTLARCIIFESATESESVTIGLVRLQQSGSVKRDLDGLIALANSALGWSTSVVLQMEDICHRHYRREVLWP